MLTNILEQIRNRAYAPNPWDEVLGNPAFAEWPLKEYGQRLKAYRESLQNIKQPETSWGQRAWQALGRLFPQGRDAEVPEWRGIKKEEDKKIEQRAKQPAGNGFTPTPFDLTTYTNTSTKLPPDLINMPNKEQMQNLQRAHEIFNKIESFLGKKLGVTSGFRMEILNNLTKESSKISAHTQGFAIDFQLPRERHHELMVEVHNNYSTIISQIISYPESQSGGFIHISISPNFNKGENQFMEDSTIKGVKKKRPYDFKLKRGRD